MPKPVMLCDKEFFITYMNKSAWENLGRITQFLPVPLDKIVGSNISAFHSPANQSTNILANPANMPYVARGKVGPETLEIHAFALTDESGDFLCPAVQWEIITERAAMEERDAAAKAAVAQVQAALDRVANGVIDELITETYDQPELEGMKQNVNNIALVLQKFLKEFDQLTAATRDGRLSERCNAGDFKGAYAQIMNGANNMLDAVLAPVAEVRGNLGMVAQGDLTAFVTSDYPGDHGVLKDALNSSLESLNTILSQVKTSSEQIATGSNQISDASQALSQGAAEQASTLEEITSSMTEMTSQTKQNAENASQARLLAVSARDGAQHGDAQMKSMVAAMNEISESSQNINKIIKVIDEIAFQTNLLALNAAVEAARAGVHGKGFAVVAEEVRNLAARSASAAKETTEMIEGSIRKVAQGSEIATDTAKALAGIVDGVTKVTDLVSEISAASDEQAQGIGQVNEGLAQINQVVQENAASAEQSAASSEELSGQAGEMRKMIGQFKLRESETSVQGMPEGMTPEMLAALQAYMAEVGAGGVSLASPAPRAAAPTTRTEAVKPSDIISLDDSDFGKY